MAKREKPIAIMISIILIAGLLYSIPSIEALDNTDYGISNPDVKIPTIGLKKAVTTWDCIYFGNYWQNDTNGDGVADQNDNKEPIKWRVLQISGNDAFYWLTKILMLSHIIKNERKLHGNLVLCEIG